MYMFLDADTVQDAFTKD